ncbi:unnamed protein product [Closterium sp. Naga37s-1]|nr:unnamed protein product [Closterium sp. Naga37s-1]
MAEAVEPSALLSELEPQVCLLLLTRCISRRISYILRTTPPDSLPLADWESWGEGNFHTLLTSAAIPLPRHHPEQLRVWRQASLPPTLGGLGIADPALERFASYLASTAAAFHLLSASSSPSHSQVLALLPLFSADASSRSQLPLRLAAAEETLPQEAIGILQKVKAARGRKTRGRRMVARGGEKKEGELNGGERRGREAASRGGSGRRGLQGGGGTEGGNMGQGGGVGGGGGGGGGGSGQEGDATVVLGGWQGVGGARGTGAAGADRGGGERAALRVSFSKSAAGMQRVELVSRSANGMGETVVSGVAKEKGVRVGW